MRTFFALLILSLSSAAGLYAQKALPQNPDAGQTQKWLRKNLVKEVRAIAKVKFDGCRMTVNEDTSTFRTASRPGGLVTGSTFNPESSTYFSAGPDSVTARVNRRKITFDLRDFNPETILTRNAFSKDKSVIVLQTSDGTNAVELTVDKTTLKRPTFEFAVKTKSAGKFAAAFRQAIKQCNE